MYLLVTELVTEFQISVRLGLRPPIFKFHSIWDWCTEWLQNDIERYKVKGANMAITLYVTIVPWSHIAVQFTLL